MRVFVTGATGYIGTAVVEALVKAGHQVTGLVRSAEKEGQLRALGGTPVRGDLKDTASYSTAVADHDGIIHVGFEYGPEGVAADTKAVETLLEQARNGSKPKSFIYTSGVLCLGNTGDKPADEDAPANAIPMVVWRPAIEKLTLDGASDTLATAVIRPGFVYGSTKGLIAGYFESATKEGAAAYIGDGQNRTSMVHKDDLAELYRLVLEKRARGMFHGVDGSAPRIAELARAASDAAGNAAATKSIPVEQARQMMGPFADAMCADQVVVTKRAREVGWNPAHAPALEAMKACFAEWKGAAGG
jgi:nucleoside-diphosphate-sugar epimerase